MKSVTPTSAWGCSFSRQVRLAAHVDGFTWRDNTRGARVTKRAGAPCFVSLTD